MIIIKNYIVTFKKIATSLRRSISPNALTVAGLWWSETAENGL